MANKQQTAEKGRQYEVMKVQLDEIFLTLEQAYMEQLVESTAEDIELREHIYQRINVLKDFMRVIDGIVSSGKISQAEIVRQAQIDQGEKREFF